MPTLGDIAKELNAELHGDAAHVVTRLGTLEHAGADALTFLANPHYLPFLKTTRAGAVLCRREQAATATVATLVVDDPYLAYARISHRFESRAELVAGIHPTAIVDANADVAETAHIGAHVSIAAGAVIGEHCIVMAGCVIGEGSHLGNHSRLWPNVTLYHGVFVGERCQIHANTVIGADGFGFAPSATGWVSIAQVGGVRIGNDVHIGASTSIDRGAVEDTIIHDDVIIDNQVQIGHNVVIGSHTAIAGTAGIAGSARIGQRCLIGGAVGIAGHIEICDDVQIAGMGRVMGNIREPGRYASGTPLVPVKEWRRNAVRFRYLDEIYRRLRRLEK